MIAPTIRLMFVACLALLAGCARQPELRWTMINVSPANEQADCHLLRFPDGQLVLIDVADAGDAPGIAVEQLKRLGVRQVSLAIISHFHRDHYGRLIDVIDSGIKIQRVIVNVPEKRIADREIPWGCDYNDVQATLAKLRERGVPYETPKAGDRLLEVKAADGTVSGIDVLCLYDGVNTPVGETDINDTSIIVRAFNASTRILFTGDLNAALGMHLAKSTDVDVRAQLLKVPHHGTEGLAPNEFFDRVGAEAAFVPSPKDLWFSDRSKRSRTYFEERKIPAYVNGIHGNVTVSILPTGYSVEAER